MSDTEQRDVIIVGGGLAGLTCGVLLSEAGRNVSILEATDRVGGRVRTDVIDGYTLDHGFQVLLTGYPACQRMLDYNALRLRRFEPGALIRHRGRFTSLGDPWRRPSQAIATATNPVGTFGDKWRIAKLRRQSRRGTLHELYQRPSASTELYLQQAGFSSSMIDQFFRPFIGGVFLDESLSVSSRMLEFVFRMFSAGDVAIPADGMGAIARQLAERLPHGSIHLQHSVASIEADKVRLTDDRVLSSNQIVVATESNAAARLLGINALETDWNATRTVYYAADEAPDGRKTLMLRGDESGPVQTATILSNVAPEYAPGDNALISVSIASSGEQDDEDPDRFDEAVRRQLTGWFGDVVDRWRMLRIFHVPYGVPRASLDPVVKPVAAKDYDDTKPDSLFVCGDHCETPSIHGAMNSGMRVAESILARMTPRQ